MVSMPVYRDFQDQAAVLVLVLPDDVARVHSAICLWSVQQGVHHVAVLYTRLVYVCCVPRFFGHSLPCCGIGLEFCVFGDCFADFFPGCLFTKSIEMF